MMKNFIIPIFSLLPLMTVITANAETKQYNIDLVVFEDTSGRYLDSEQWPVIHHPEDISNNTIEIPESDAVLADESAIKNKKTTSPETNRIIKITHEPSDALTGHVARLKKSSRYKVLLNQSWQQMGLSESDAISIYIDTIKSENALESNIQGTIKLILGRYLHIHTDLNYKRLKNSYKPNSQALYGNMFDEFRIKSQRRMRSNELHYIDHPLLGILVLVTPIKQPEPS